MTKPVFATRADALKAGYKSRRHRDEGPKHEAREQWRRNKSPGAKRAAAAVLTAERAGRSDDAQLALIEKRRGDSARETARINARIANPFKGAK